MSEEADKGEGNTIQLRVVNQVVFISLLSILKDGNEVVFKIKKQTPLRKLIEAYCSRQGLDMNSIRFLYDGNRIQPDQTPKEVQYHMVEIYLSYV